MMDKLFKQMMEEKHDFYHYMELYEACSDPSIKAKLHAIASQEAQHYKELYDIVFKEDPTKPWTMLEKVVHHEAKEWYEEMLEELKHFGK
jgi:rubrerythrin